MTVRSRLTLLSTAVVAVALVVGAFALTAVLRQQRVAALDRILSARVAQTADLVADDRVPDALPVTEPGETVQVLDASGAVVATSANASLTLPLLSAGELAELRARAGEGTALAGVDDGVDGPERVAVRAATYRGTAVTVAASLPMAEVQGLVAALRVALFGVVPVLTGAFALVVWWLLGATLAPVTALRRAAADVAAVGGPGALPVPPRDDEIAALARTLNEMLDRLDVAAVRQRRFVADAAHELRSPLAALRATVEVAAVHPASTSTAELAGELAGEVARLGRLVDDLLLLARVGTRALAPVPVDLAALVAGPAREPGRVPVEVTGAGRAVGDADDVVRVLRNLLDNAVRHARTRVVVRVGPGRVEVDDDGPGIPAAERERVFERFVRLDDARERDAGGSGLGLAISRELAREQGGDVRVGDSPQGGARVILRLPAPRDH